MAHDLEQDRAALTMIHGMPYNAEAPPTALQAEITPTQMHYVRSNFAVPEHDGTLVIGGAVERPLTLTVDDLRALPAVEHAVTLECAGNGRLAMRPLPNGEPWGDYAVSTARWTGARLSDVLRQAGPAAGGVEIRCEGADRGAYLLQPVLPETDAGNLGFERSLPLAVAVDPASEILIAYAMNGEPLTPDHGAPFRLIVPHWYAVASVKWLTRIDVTLEPYVGEFQTGHYVFEWADRPHEPVTIMRVRARVTEPASGTVLAPGRQTVRGKAWSGSGPVAGSRSAWAATASGMPPTSRRRPAPTTGRSGRSAGMRRPLAARASAPGPRTRPATPSRRCRRGTGSATATTRSRSRTSTCGDPQRSARLDSSRPNASAVTDAAAASTSTSTGSVIRLNRALPAGGPGRNVAHSPSRRRGPGRGRQSVWSASTARRRSRKGACAAFSRRAASSRSNHSTRSISGKDCMRPERGGHSRS